MEQQPCTPSQFWRLEIQSQGVSKAVLPLKVLGENLSHEPLQAPGGYQQTLAFLGLWVHLCLLYLWLRVAFSPLLRWTAVTVSEPTLIQHDLNSITYAEALMSKYGHIHRHQGLGLEKILCRTELTTNNQHLLWARFSAKHLIC